MNRENRETLLIKRIREGDEYAFEIAFLKYYAPLSKYIRKFVRSSDLAKSIVQEVFADIWESRNELDTAGHLRGLLYEAARNKALNYIKHQKISEEYIKRSRRQRNNHYMLAKPFRDAPQKALLNATHEAIENLPPKARRIFQLNRNEGLTYKEIAGYLGISIKTVEAQMSRVLKKLRKSLSEYLPILLVLGLWLTLS